MSATGTFPNAEHELRAIIDSIPALVARYLPDGTPDFVNQTWRDFTGLSLEDLKGHRWGVGIHPDDLASITERWRAHLADGTGLCQRSSACVAPTANIAGCRSIANPAARRNWRHR